MQPRANPPGWNLRDKASDSYCPAWHKLLKDKQDELVKSLLT